MKRASIAFALSLLTAFAFAQAADLGEPDPERIGVESAQQKLKEISVDKFENAGYWISSMSTDEGYTTTCSKAVPQERFRFRKRRT